MLKKSCSSPVLRTNDGFAMVVIALLFVAFAVIAAVLVEHNTATQYIVRRDVATQQLSRLANAIIEYGVTNQANNILLYPCPAQENIPTSNSTFGQAVTNCSSTVGDSGSFPSVKTSTNIAVMGAAASPILRGMVPVKTLVQYGITQNDAFDPWNNRIEYVMNRQLSVGSTTSLSAAQAVNPTVTYPNTPALIPAPDFILISYGRDGVGATKRDSTAVGISCPTTPGVNRLVNCQVSTVFTVLPTYTAGNATSLTYFDDIVTYYTQ